MSRLLSVALLGAAAAAHAAVPTRDNFFASEQIWSAHITVSADDWKAMAPKNKGIFGPRLKPGEKPAKPVGDVAVSAFGFEFPYVKGDFECEGTVRQGVGLRFKGNSSYTSSDAIKKPFKVDFDRNAPGQTFLGFGMLNFANNALDPSQLRETLSYRVFRGCGVPAPRTAFVRLYLTVPGLHDRTFLGLYTVIEQVDKSFLKDHFGNGKGMLLKPERAPGLPVLGDEWSDKYKERYNPKKDPTETEARRFVAFIKLVHTATDDEFHAKVGALLDINEFLRFVAANALLGNLDSFVGTGHNYYLYCRPDNGKFVWLPWDLNLSFAGFGAMGAGDQITEWAIAKPYSGRNRLIERVLAIPEYDAAYRNHLQAFVAGPFAPKAIADEAAALKKRIQPVLDEEKAAGRVGATGLMTALLVRSPDMATFAAKRVQSVELQLAGKSEGRVLSGSGNKLSDDLAAALMRAADANRDRKLSAEELDAAVARFFADRPDGIDVKALTAAIEGALPAGAKPAAVPLFGLGPPAPTRVLSQGLLKKCSPATGEPAGRDAALAAARQLFREWDKDDDRRLNTTEVSAGLDGLLPKPAPPRGGPPAKGKVS